MERPNAFAGPYERKNETLEFTNLYLNGHPLTQTEMLTRFANQRATFGTGGSQMELRFAESLANPKIASEFASESTNL